MYAESSLNNAKEGAFVIQWTCLCPAGTADVNMEEAQPAEGGRPAKKLRHGACLPCLTKAELCSPEVLACLLVFNLLQNLSASACQTFSIGPVFGVVQHAMFIWVLSGRVLVMLQ